MFLLNLFVIVFIVTILLFSIPLTLIIYKSISEKPIASQSLIDLLYRDCILSNYANILAFATAIIGCLSSEKLTLNFVASAVFSISCFVCVSFISLLLSFSGILRLISIVRNSEEKGIQLLGPDDLAIWIVRSASISISLIFTLTMSFVFNTFPGLYYFLNQDESFDVVDLGKTNPGVNLFAIFPAVAALINIVCKIYSLVAKQKMVSADMTMATKPRFSFSFSLGGAILICFPLFAAGLTTFLKRRERFYFSYPAFFFTFDLLVPLFIISRNEKMKLALHQVLSHHSNAIRHFFSINIKRHNPAVSCT